MRVNAKSVIDRYVHTKVVKKTSFGGESMVKKSTDFDTFVSI